MDIHLLIPHRCIGNAAVAVLLAADVSEAVVAESIL